MKSGRECNERLRWKKLHFYFHSYNLGSLYLVSHCIEIILNVVKRKLMGAS